MTSFVASKKYSETSKPPASPTNSLSSGREGATDAPSRPQSQSNADQGRGDCRVSGTAERLVAFGPGWLPPVALWTGDEVAPLNLTAIMVSRTALPRTGLKWLVGDRTEAGNDVDIPDPADLRVWSRYPAQHDEYMNLRVGISEYDRPGDRPGLDWLQFGYGVIV